jgi:hypothetical protein
MLAHATSVCRDVEVMQAPAAASAVAAATVAATIAATIAPAAAAAAAAAVRPATIVSPTLLTHLMQDVDWFEEAHAWSLGVNIKLTQKRSDLTREDRVFVLLFDSCRLSTRSWRTLCRMMTRRAESVWVDATCGLGAAHYWAMGTDHFTSRRVTCMKLVQHARGLLRTTTHDVYIPALDTKNRMGSLLHAQSTCLHVAALMGHDVACWCLIHSRSGSTLSCMTDACGRTAADVVRASAFPARQKKRLLRILAQTSDPRKLRFH